MNKICIILTNPKDIDFFYNLINIYHLKDVDILYNDFKKNWNNKILQKFKLKYPNLRLKRLSSVYFFKKRYEILISTGDNPPLNFLYLISIKLNLNDLYLKISKIIYKIFHKVNSFLRYNIKEKTDFRTIDYVIGYKRFCFARGYDLKPSYPGISRLQTFNNFMCVGKIDRQILKSKNKASIIIGYPRYDIKIDIKNSRKSLINEFGIKNEKKIIYWLPTYRSSKVENQDLGIDKWIDEVKSVTDEFNVIIRPHPDRVFASKEILKKINYSNFFIDLDITRNLAEIYKSTDYIFCEISDPFYGAIYNKSKILVLDHENRKESHSKMDEILKEFIKYYKIDMEKIVDNKDLIKEYLNDKNYWNNQKIQTEKLHDILYEFPEENKIKELFNV